MGPLNRLDYVWVSDLFGKDIHDIVRRTIQITCHHELSTCLKFFNILLSCTSRNTESYPHFLRRVGTLGRGTLLYISYLPRVSVRVPIGFKMFHATKREMEVMNMGLLPHRPTGTAQIGARASPSFFIADAGMRISFFAFSPPSYHIPFSLVVVPI